MTSIRVLNHLITECEVPEFRYLASFHEPTLEVEGPIVHSDCEGAVVLIVNSNYGPLQSKTAPP